MTWFMTVAAGAAIGYFLVQYLMKNGRNTENADPDVPRPRLHKSASDRQVAGVCGGLAEYFGVDSTIVRIATVLLIFGWGSGLLAYIICALVFPTE